MIKRILLPALVIIAGLAAFASLVYFTAPRCTAQSAPATFIANAVKIEGC